MKKILILVVVLLITGAAYWYFMMGNSGSILQRQNPEAPYLENEQPNISTETDKFSGKLEEVNTGCFADGECYVVVGGKHVTILTGFRIDRPTVGQIIGVPTVGELKSKIGSEMEVYAEAKEDGTYTLYGSPDYYVKLK
jgi:hypothetical protein